jgi:hypothetical protein
MRLADVKGKNREGMHEGAVWVDRAAHGQDGESDSTHAGTVR